MYIKSSSTFLRGTLWAMVGFIVPQIFNFILYLVVARVVEQENFGVLGVITSSVAVFANLAGLGMGKTATYYIARFISSDKLKISNVISTTYLISIVSSLPFIIGLVLFTREFSTSLLNLEGYDTELKLAGLLFFFNLILGIQVSILTGFHKFKEISVLNGVRAMLSAVLSVITVFTLNILGVVVSFIIAVMITNIIAAYYLKITYLKNNIIIKYAPFKLDRQILSEVSLPNFLMGILVFPIQWLINLIIAHSENGYYYLGMLTGINQIKNILILVTGIISNVNLPLLTSASSRLEKNQKEEDSLISANLDLTMVFVLPISTMLLFYCNQLMGLFGDNYRLAEGTLFFVIIGTSISAIGAPIGTAIQANGKMWLGFGLNLFWSVLHILLVYMFWMELNVLSYGISFFVSHLLLFLLGYTIYSNRISVELKRKINILISHTIISLLFALISLYFQVYILASIIWGLFTFTLYLNILSEDIKNGLIKIIKSFFPINRRGDV